MYPKPVRQPSKFELKIPLLIAIGCSTLLGQIGQYPPGSYPPGTYPPGQYPPGQNPPSSGIPGLGRRSKKSTSSDASQQPTVQLSGYIRKIDDKSLDLEGTDARFITIQLSDKTSKPTGLKSGDPVDIQATRDEDSQYHAVSIKVNPNVKRNSDAAAQEANEAPEPPPDKPGQAQAEESGDNAPKAVNDQLRGRLYDDDGPPTLKRGKPAARPADTQQSDSDSSDSAVRPRTVAQAVPQAAPQATAALPAEPNSREVFLEKARNVSGDFLNSLPNYVCQEFATRYISGHHDQWTAQDIVSADLVYDDHKESYKNLAINGKPIKGSPEQTGAWSTGELGTILADLFSPATAADFHYVHDASIVHQAASVYDFEVDRPHSHWKVSLPAEFIYPAYQGSLWIDKKNARALRIEMQAKDIPEQFSLDTVESAVDYDYVSLGTEKYLLPVHAETLSCVRSSSVCEKNVIEFRNYHKFTGESVIKFGDSKP
jgi:hypothetical protein